MSSMQIVIEPTSVKMITGETLVTYAVYPKIPKEPSEEDLDILDAIDIDDSLFVFVPVIPTKGNDGYTFIPWLNFTDLKAYRLNRNDIIIAARADVKTTEHYDHYIAAQNIVMADAVQRLFMQLGISYEEDEVDSMITSKSIQYLADLNNIHKTKH